MRPQFVPVLTVALVLVAVAVHARRQFGPPAGPGGSARPTGATSVATAAGDGQALFQANCTRYHSTARVTKHDAAREPWPQLVAARRERRATSLTDQEAAAIVSYLEQTHPPR